MKTRVVQEQRPAESKWEVLCFTVIRHKPLNHSTCPLTLSVWITHSVDTVFRRRIIINHKP